MSAVAGLAVETSPKLFIRADVPHIVTTAILLAAALPDLTVSLYTPAVPAIVAAKTGVTS